MLYRNGLIVLFLNTEFEEVTDDEIQAVVEKVDDDFIKKHTLDGPSALAAGRVNLPQIETMNDLNWALRRFGGFKTTTYQKGTIDQLFFGKTEKGRCAHCGSTDDVIGNTAAIFPYEVEWGKGQGLFLAPPQKRLAFCRRCAFLIYSGMGNTFNVLSGRNGRKQKVRRINIIFDSILLASLYLMVKNFRRIQTFANSNARKLTLVPGGTHDALLFSIYEFFCTLAKISPAPAETDDDEKTSANEGEPPDGSIITNADFAPFKFVKNINMFYLTSGKEEIPEGGMIDGNRLFGLMRFFMSLHETANKTDATGRRRPPFEAFMEGMTFQGSNEADTLRNEFCGRLLNKEVSYHLITKLIFLKLGDKKQKDLIKKGFSPAPPYYLTVIRRYLEVFGTEEERKRFEELNRLGYYLGTAMKGTKNLENFVWEVFRARGFEELLGALSELQLKLKQEQDWRPVLDNKNDWKTTKSIILNGMINGIYSGQREVKKREEGN